MDMALLSLPPPVVHLPRFGSKIFRFVFRFSLSRFFFFFFKCKIFDSMCSMLFRVPLNREIKVKEYKRMWR